MKNTTMTTREFTLKYARTTKKVLDEVGFQRWAPTDVGVTPTDAEALVVAGLADRIELPAGLYSYRLYF